MPNVPIGDGIALLASGGVGAAVFKLAQVWIEKRSGRPSKAKDSADIVAASAAFQLALNAAAQGIVGDLRSTVDRLEAEVENLKRDHESCQTENEQLRQAARQLEQKLDSLMRQLRDPRSTQRGGSLASAVIEFADDDVKVTRPTRGKK